MNRSHHVRQKSKPGSSCFLTVGLILLALGVTPAAHAAGPVSVCDEAHLRTALTGGGTVTFSCNGTITLTSGTPLTITQTTTVDGTGQAVTISGGGATQVFVVQQQQEDARASSLLALSRSLPRATTFGVSLTLNNLTIAKGSTSGNGGGVQNNGGTLTVNNIVFSGNSAQLGGAILNFGTLTISGSTFTGNSGEGGAIYNGGTVNSITGTSFGSNSSTSNGGAIYNQGTVTLISGSAFTGNSAGDGGAIFDAGTLTVNTSTFVNNTAGNGGAIFEEETGYLTNSTLAGNTASSRGGGVYTNGTIFATFVTFSANSAASGSGGDIYNSGGSVDLEDTIIAGSDSTGGNCVNNGGSIYSIGGYDLDSGSSCGLGGTSLSNTNPQLGALANNGGPTMTEALMPTSQAINKIPPGTNSCGPTALTPITTDQRGTARPQGAGCDIGAYEFVPMGAGTGEIDGQVTDNNKHAVSGAPVQACASATAACAFTGFSDMSGNYMATGLADGSYVITAFPPAGSVLLPEQTTAKVTGGSHVTGANIQLGAPIPPPAGTGFSPTVGTGGGGVQTIYYGSPTTLSTTGCPNGAATYKIVLVSGAVASQGSMLETPAGSGHYTVNLPPLMPSHGDAVVTISIKCPGVALPTTFSFPIYIDPSGVVKDQFGVPIPGATVTLLSSSSAMGTFTAVSNGSAVMSPANRNNPDKTSSLGLFGWDVIAGFYEVKATAPGCNTVTSGELTIPPAVTGIELDLTCAVTAPVPVSGICNGLYTGTLNGNLNVSSGQSCTFVSGGVNGNVQMSGGNLTLSKAKVTGNVQINGGTFSILPSTTITGNLEIQNIPGPAGTVVNQICGATVNGNLQFHNNGTAVQIGSVAPSCPGNTVGGNMEVHDNTAATLVFDNTVKGNLQDHNNNTPSVPATEVIGNVVTGSLSCQNNSSIIGMPNPGSHNTQGDCAPPATPTPFPPAPPAPPPPTPFR